MNLVLSPFQDVMPNEVNIHILSFLEKRDLQAVACTCKTLKQSSEDFQLWKSKAEIEFGKFISDGAKQSNKSWRQTYEELEASKQTRVKSAPEFIQKLAKKIKTDDLQYLINRAAEALFGFVRLNPSTHYYPTGQTSFLGNHKITVFKKT